MADNLARINAICEIYASGLVQGGFSFWSYAEGWQLNIKTGLGGFICQVGATQEEAISKAETIANKHRIFNSPPMRPRRRSIM